jgi:uncharacterized membrane protein YphA (DoxX/SURF4 family)
VALLLIRTVDGSVAAAKVAEVLTNGPFGAKGALALLALCAAVCLILGLLTPVASGVVNVTASVSWFVPAASSLWTDGTAPLLVAAVAAGLALLGPGAYSIDARLFGRREVVVSLGPPSARR